MAQIISIATPTPDYQEEIRVIEFRHNLGCRREIVFTKHLDKHLNCVQGRLNSCAVVTVSVLATSKGVGKGRAIIREASLPVEFLLMWLPPSSLASSSMAQEEAWDYLDSNLCFVLWSGSQGEDCHTLQWRVRLRE